MIHKRCHWFGLLLIGVIVVGGALGPSASRTAQAQAGGTLGYGSRVYGIISAEAPLAAYSFSGNPGDFVAVTADSWTGTLDIHLDLVAPNGVVLHSSTQNTLTDDPMGAYLAVVLPDAGIYLLRLSGENQTIGDFLLMLMGRSAAVATPLVFGQAVDVTIPQNGPAQYFSFEAEDCPTSLVVSNPSQGQPFTFPFVVKVRDQRGQTVALLRGGEQTEDWVTVQPNSGHYEVEALAADPALAGSFRLLVTCSGSNPGCPPGQTGVTGIPSLQEECDPCPGTEGLVPGGGCADLNLRTQQGLHMSTATTVFWDPMTGADGYTVYVTGITTEGDEEYLTHADWVPGDPTEFTWILPHEGYIGFEFTLEVLAGDSVICAQSTVTNIPRTQPECPDLGLTGAVTDASVNAVALSWTPGLGADQFALDMYAITGVGEVYAGRLTLPGDATGRAFDHLPPEFDGVRFVLWMTRGGILCSDEVTIPLRDQPLAVCANFGLALTAQTGTTVTLTWTPYPGAENYAFSIMDAAHTLLPGYPVLLPGTQLSATLDLPPGSYIFSVGPWTTAAGTFCAQEVAVTVSQQEQQPGLPCAVRTDRANVPVQVGPGPGRSVFTYLPTNQDIPVIGQAVDEEGAAWWQIDKNVIPGGEATISLWVAQSDVITVGDCSQVPAGEIPPIIPEEEEPQGPGTWLPCGSCDSCGHPANECLTSPEGACLWDPTTCAQQPPGGGEELPTEEVEPTCYSIGVTIDMGRCYGSGSAMLDVRPNCEGSQYTAGTTISAHAVAVDPKCTVDYWSGCGVSGSGSSVSFTATSSCTLTAHMGY